LARPRRSRRTLTVVVVLVLVSIAIITIDERGGSRVSSDLRNAASRVFAPIRKGVDDVLRPIGNFFAGAVNYGSVAQENAKLQATLGRLRQQQAEQAYEQRQLRQMAALLHLSYLGSLQTVTAQTVTVNVSNFVASIGIDKGTADGVALGMPVVGAGGLVGQVVQAFRHSATVRLLTDGRSKVGVSFGRHATQAVVNGEGSGDPLAVDFVPPGTPMRKGQVLFTNGLAGAEYPNGIPVAFVTSYDTVPGASQMTVVAQPMANLHQLTYVDVVLWEPAP